MDVTCPRRPFGHCESLGVLSPISGAKSSGRAAEPSRLRSRPAACFSRTASGGEPAADRVGPDVVVVVPPALDDDAGFGQAGKTSSFRHAPHSLPLKLLAKPFCCGLPGAM